MAGTTARTAVGTTRSGRTYDVAGRRAAAEERRARVVDEAVRLFAADGWAGTTVPSVAEAAGVSAALVTSAFGGKAGLLQAAVEQVLGPWHREFAGRLAHQAILGEPDLGRRLDAVVDFACATLPALAPLVDALAGAAEQDPVAIEALESARARLVETSARVATLLTPGPVRPGVADEVYVLLLMENYLALVHDRGWDLERYGAWLRRSLRAAVEAGRAEKSSGKI